MGGFFDVEQKQREIEAMEAQMGAPDFWNNNERAQKHIGKLNGLKKIIGGLVAFNKKLDDAAVMVELVEAAEPAEREAYARELNDTVTAMVEELDKLEIASFLTGQFDRNNAIFSIQAGAGGTESNDWADILFRMYSRWCERRGFEVELMDVQPGDQAGISKATILIKGENAYGYAKAERGVHRLVRISPFDSNKRRTPRSARSTSSPKSRRRSTSTCPTVTFASTCTGPPARAARASTPRTQPCASRTFRPVSWSCAKTNAPRSRTRPPP